MEKAVSKRKLLKRGLKGEISDFMLKIVSLIIAVIIWFAMSITKYPTVNKTITNVPVDFSIKGTAAERKGLSALQYKDFTVDVEIQGMNYEIGTYAASDLTATVDTDAVTKAGTYKLDIEVKSNHPADRCTIVSVSPQTVEVKFDQMENLKFPLNVSAPNVSAQEGFTLKEVSLDPTEVEISGPEDILSRVDKVVAQYNDSMSLNDDTTVTTNSIILYDADDNRLDSSNCTMSLNSVDITFTIFKKVTMNLQSSFLDIPPGFDLGSLPYTLTADQLQVITPQLDAKGTEDVLLTPVSFYDIKPGASFITQVDSILSGGEINQSGIDQVEMRFDLTGYTTKVFSIKGKDIEITNVPEGKSVSIDSEQLSNVIMIGPEKDMKKLKASDLTAVIDLTDVQSTGSLSQLVTVYSKDHNKIWNIGSHEAVVTINDSAVTPAASSSAAGNESAAS